MKPRAWATGAWLSSAGVVLLLVACSEPSPSPPFEQLRLRDALSADPAVIAGLGAQARSELAVRMEQAREAEHGEGEPVAIPGDPAAAPLDQVRAVDEARQQQEADSLVIADLVPHAPARKPGQDDVPARLADVASVEGGPPTAATEAMETRALDGQAGRIVATLVRASGKTRVVRVVGWPAGVAVVGDAVYVNASWLVTMAALEPEPSGEQRPSAGGWHQVRPQVFHANPYDPFATINVCVRDVQGRCASCLQTGRCDAEATLADEANGRSECEFLSASVRRVQELCALALLSVPKISACVEDEACYPPVGDNTKASLGAADSFLGDDRCVRALNLCLSGRDESLDGTSHDSSSSSCGGCNSCNCKNGNNNSKCETAPRRSGEPPQGLGLGWLLVPLAYLASRMRRNP